MINAAVNITEFTHHFLMADGIVYNTAERTPIMIHTIGRHLSNLARFNGATNLFYSVAQHSYHVAHDLFNTHKCPDLALFGVLHDAHEAMIGDITTPVAALLGVGELIDAVKDWIQHGIHETCGLPAPTIDQAAAIKAADRAILAREFRDVMPRALDTDREEILYASESAVGPVIKPVGPTTALTKWLEAFNLYATLSRNHTWEDINVALLHTGKPPRKNQ